MRIVSLFNCWLFFFVYRKDFQLSYIITDKRKFKQYGNISHMRAHEWDSFFDLAMKLWPPVDSSCLIVLLWKDETNTAITPEACVGGKFRISSNKLENFGLMLPINVRQSADRGTRKWKQILEKVQSFFTSFLRIADIYSLHLYHYISNNSKPIIRQFLAIDLVYLAVEKVKFIKIDNNAFHVLAFVVPRWCVTRHCRNTRSKEW
jgi:hypothetical protein